jgi:hypothetical protein
LCAHAGDGGAESAEDTHYIPPGRTGAAIPEKAKAAFGTCVASPVPQKLFMYFNYLEENAASTFACRQRQNA